MHPHVVFLHNLENGHTSNVNVVKFSPGGKQLASGGDDHKIILWEKKEKPIFGTESREYLWAPKQILLGHILDVVDLKWFPGGKHILSGSVDNSAILWSVEKGKQLMRIEHNHYVQGVAVDPFEKYFLT